MANLGKAAVSSEDIRDPEVMFRRFSQVARWAGEVLAAQRKLGITEDEEMDRILDDDDEASKPNLARVMVDRFKAYREKQKSKQAAMDRPLEPVGGALLNTPSRVATTATSVQPKGTASSGQRRTQIAKLPHLKFEPWLEKHVHSSRFY